MIIRVEVGQVWSSGSANYLITKVDKDQRYVYARRDIFQREEFFGKVKPDLTPDDWGSGWKVTIPSIKVGQIWKQKSTKRIYQVTKIQSIHDRPRIPDHEDQVAWMDIVGLPHQGFYPAAFSLNKEGQPIKWEEIKDDWEFAGYMEDHIAEPGIVRYAQKDAEYTSKMFSKVLKEKDSYTMSNTRQELAHKVIEIFENNAYPFGGYLRDKIAGVEFTDLDLYFPQRSGSDTAPVFNSFEYMPTTLRAIKDKCRAHGLEITKKESKKIYNRSTGIRVNKTAYTIKDPKSGAEIQVDMVRSESYACDHPFTALDADVNCLWYSHKTKKIEAAPGYDMELVKQHIKNRQFEIPNGVEISSNRLNKLLRKGFRPILPGEEALTITSASESNLYVKPGLLAMVGDDATDAAYRIAEKQISKAAQAGLLHLLKDNGMDESRLKVAAELLATEGGRAILALIIGYLMTYSPLAKDRRVQRLAKEFRVEAMATTGNMMAEGVLEFIIPSLHQAMNLLPQKKESKKIRVKQSDPTPTEEELDFEEERRAVA